MSFSLKQLARKTGMSTFAIRSWVRDERIPRTEARGPMTRYGEEHLLRIRAIQHLRRGGERLDAASERVKSATSHEELRELAGMPTTKTKETPAALGVARAPASIDALILPAYRAENARAREVWEHIPICPGVELRVRVDADSEAKRVARAIEDAFAR
jgi:Ca-activated chloride channel family protein